MRSVVLALGAVVGVAAGFGAGWAAARASAAGPAPVTRQVVDFHPLPQASPPTAEGGLVIPDPKSSLLYFPFNTVTPTEGGKKAGYAIIRCIDGDLAGCAEADEQYNQLIPAENFGGEYPSLQWFAEYMLSDEAGQAKMRAESKDAARFVAFFEPQGWMRMRQYVEYKYEMRKQQRGNGIGSPGSMPGGPYMRWMDEFVRFNSPRRDEWEHSREIVDVVGPKPGMAIADIGAGSGFFSFRLADQVGEDGKVYAVELDPPHLDFLRQVKRDEAYANVDVVEGDEAGTGLPKDSVDVVFLCSTYQTIYGSIRQTDRDAWIQSLKDTLRPGGRIVISENAPDGEVEGAPPYRGISISKHLVVGQLTAYGFKLVEEHQYIPQRYILVFEEGA